MGRAGVSGYLLDTHALLWALTDPDRLSPRALEIIGDTGSALAVSAASAWEIATKHRLGRLGQADGLVAAYMKHLSRLGIDELPIAGEHALLAGGMAWDHRDPFDRMIAAQAMIEGFPVVTKDRVLHDLDGIATIW